MNAIQPTCDLNGNTLLTMSSPVHASYTYVNKTVTYCNEKGKGAQCTDKRCR